MYRGVAAIKPIVSIFIGHQLKCQSKWMKYVYGLVYMAMDVKKPNRRGKNSRVKRFINS